VGSYISCYIVVTRIQLHPIYPQPSILVRPFIIMNASAESSVVATAPNALSVSNNVAGSAPVMTNVTADGATLHPAAASAPLDGARSEAGQEKKSRFKVKNVRLMGI
jgi:hypothetical protein